MRQNSLAARAATEILDVLAGMGRSLRDISRAMIHPDGIIVTAIIAIVFGVGVAWFFIGLGYDRNSLPGAIFGLDLIRCTPATDKQFLWIILGTFASGVSAIFLVAESISLHVMRQDYRRRNKQLSLRVFVPFGVVFVMFAGGGLTYLIFNC